MTTGIILHVIAKITFVLVAYAIHIFLGKKLTPEIYGSIGVILSIININYSFLSNGVRQSTSHLIAEQKYSRNHVIKMAYKIQIGVAFLLSFINYFFAQTIANILQQPELASYIRFTAIIIPFTAIYFLNVGILNGFKLLAVEAIIVTIYPLLRLSIIPFVQFVFDDSILGTICGFLVAASVTSIISGIAVYKHNKSTQNAALSELRLKDFIKISLDFLSFFINVTIILNLDMLFVNALEPDSNKVGYYTAATNFSKVSYYLLSAIYLVALPLITERYSKKDIIGCRKIIQRLFTIAIVFILPIVSIAAPLANSFLVSLYSFQYVIAETATRILMISQFFLGSFVILNIIVCSTQSKKFSIVVSFLMVCCDALLCYLLIPHYSIEGAAIASFITNLIGLIISLIQVQKSFGNYIRKKDYLIIVINIVIFVAGTLLSVLAGPINFIYCLFICIFGYSLLLLILTATKTYDIYDVIDFLKRK